MRRVPDDNLITSSAGDQLMMKLGMQSWRHGVGKSGDCVVGNGPGMNVYYPGEWAFELAWVLNWPGLS